MLRHRSDAGLARENNSTTLVGIIKALRSRRVTHSKDKVFELYGVLHRLDIFPPDPDYHKPLFRIHHDFYVTLLNRYPSTINLLVDSGEGSLDCPTWVPDWNAVDEREWLPASYIYDPINEEQNSDTEHFKVCEDKLLLHVKWIGTATFCSEALPRLGDCNQSENSILVTDELASVAITLSRWLTQIRSHISVARPQGNVTDALFTALTGGRVAFDSLQASRDNADSRAFDAWFRAMDNSFPIIDHHVASADALIAVREFLAENPKVSGFILRCCEHFDGRRGVFFSPEAGIGTGPPAMVPGDRIVYVPGVSAPLVANIYHLKLVVCS